MPWTRAPSPVPVSRTRRHDTPPSVVAANPTPARKATPSRSFRKTNPSGRAAGRPRGTGAQRPASTSTKLLSSPWSVQTAATPGYASTPPILLVFVPRATGTAGPSGSSKRYTPRSPTPTTRSAPPATGTTVKSTSRSGACTASKRRPSGSTSARRPPSRTRVERPIVGPHRFLPRQSNQRAGVASGARGFGAGVAAEGAGSAGGRSRGGRRASAHPAAADRQRGRERVEFRRRGAKAQGRKKAKHRSLCFFASCVPAALR